MTRDDYIRELRSRLRGLDNEEIENAITYCEEYFDEVGDSEKALQDLGSPAKFAAQIKADAAIKETIEVQRSRKPRSTMKSFWMILGGIFALPIALPLLLAVIILVIALGIVVVALLFAGIAVVIACIFAAIVNFFASFLYMGDPGQMMVMNGLSLISLGIAIFSVVGITVLIRKVIPKMMERLTSFYQRHKEKGNKNYEEI